MRCLLCICLLLSVALKAQDKLFFSDGSTRKGIIVSIAKDAVYFKNNDTSNIQKIKKNDLVMAENYKGIRFLFSTAPNKTDSARAKVQYMNNSLGVQPLAIFLGRATVVYERFSKDHKVGFVFPLSLTFDPIGSLYSSNLDTSKNALKRIKGVKFIAGIDVNFYIGHNEHAKFFIGPRARYGTDLLLRGIEAYSLQTQIGWRFDSPRKKFSQHLSAGFGFARVLSTPAGKLVEPKQVYGWYSINYRLGINW